MPSFVSALPRLPHVGRATPLGLWPIGPCQCVTVILVRSPYGRIKRKNVSRHYCCGKRGKLQESRIGQRKSPAALGSANRANRNAVLKLHHIAKVPNGQPAAASRPHGLGGANG